MTRRTKIWICVGLLLGAAGVVLVRRPTVKPQIEVKFVRYESNGAPVLSLTNKGQQPVRFPGMDVWLSSDVSWHTFHASPANFMPSVLVPGGGTQLVVWPIQAPQPLWPVTQGTAFVQCAAQPSKVWRGVEELLSSVGIEIASTGYVVTVTLPPSPSNTPPASPPR